MAEGVKRLEHFKMYGASDYAFGWQDMPEAQYWKAARGGTAIRPNEHAARLN
jgi:hypothetical protein